MCCSLVTFFCCFLVLFLHVVVILSHCWCIVHRVACVNVTIGPLHYLCYCWFITLLMLFMVCHVANGGASCCITSVIFRLSFCWFIALLVFLLIHRCYYWFSMLLMSCYFVTLSVLLLVHHIINATCYAPRHLPKPLPPCC